MRVRLALLLSLALALPTATGFAGVPPPGPGSLDPSFGSNGVVRIGFGGGHDLLDAATTQLDGKLVSVGNCRNGEATQFLVLRHLADGTPDAAFGAGGRVRLTLSGAYDAAHAVTVGADGRITVAGESNGRIAAVRLLADGSPDPSFGVAGVVTIGATTDNAVARAVLLWDSGTYLVGKKGVSPTSVAVMLRLTAGGALDPTFSGDGRIDEPIFIYGEATAAVLQPDGRLLVAGWAAKGNHRRAVALLRYSAGGTPDANFASSGRLTLYLGTANAQANALTMVTSATLPARIAVAGTLDVGAGYEGLVVQFNLNGSLDATFGTGGSRSYAIAGGNDDQFTGIRATLDHSGEPSHLLISGTHRFAPSSPLPRLLAGSIQPNGVPEPAFDGDGFTLLTPPTAQEAGQGLTFASGNLLVLVGYRYAGSNTGFDILMAACSLTTGMPATGFGSAGVMVEDCGDVSGQGYALAVQPDGAVVVAGGSSGYMTVARLLPDGAPDPSFSGDGRLRLNLGGSAEARGVAIQTDGRIVLAGWSAASLQTLALVRLLPDGSLDPTFDGDGWLISPTDLLSSAADLAIQADGRIVIVGESSLIEGQPRLRISRFLSDGRPDSTFSGDGHLVNPFPADGTSGSSVAVQGDGRIVTAGYSWVGFDPFQFQVARLLPNGLPDGAFGIGGQVQSYLGQGNAIAEDVIVMPDGRVMVCGRVGNEGEWRHAILRYRSNGTLDPLFDQNGIVQDDLPGVDAGSFGVVRQSTGQILQVGDQGDGEIFRACVQRFHTDGSPDASFGGAGHVVIDPVPGGNAHAEAVAVDATDRVLVAGTAADLMCIFRLDGTPPQTGVPDDVIDGPTRPLARVSPNPARSVSTLSIELEREASVAIDILDVAGRHVRRLVSDRAMPAGRHDLAWDLTDESGRRVAAGVYLARVRAGDRFESQRLVVLR